MSARHYPEFISEDALKLPIKTNSVDLVITSPSYFGMNTSIYGGNSNLQINNVKDQKKFLKNIFLAIKEMSRTLKNDGSIIINVGPYGEVPFKLISMVLEETDLMLRGTIAWRYRQDDKRNREHPIYLNNMWIHFVKSRNYYHNEFFIKKIDKDFNYVSANNITSEIDKQLELEGNYMLDTFPEVFAQTFIESFSRPGSLVLDPFGGTGIVASQAYLLGRRSISNDISELQTKIAQRRIDLLESL